MPQAFTKAYVRAWKLWSHAKAEGIVAPPYTLVIEEINRGNCAQIFGDLFQLLDRNDDGYSDYEIIPDTDLQEYLAGQFDGYANLDDKIMKGEIMVLPPNLWIVATMNTSDQSLFPIDSAFKRRWDWEQTRVPVPGAQRSRRDNTQQVCLKSDFLLMERHF